MKMVLKIVQKWFIQREKLPLGEDENGLVWWKDGKGAGQKLFGTQQMPATPVLRLCRRARKTTPVEKNTALGQGSSLDHVCQAGARGLSPCQNECPTTGKEGIHRDTCASVGLQTPR
jgi:hypothetical protein